MQNCRNHSTLYNSYRQPTPDYCENPMQKTLEEMPIAMAYVPWQKWCKIYDAEKAFHHGTIFQELDLPFRGIGGCQK